MVMHIQTHTHNLIISKTQKKPNGIKGNYVKIPGITANMLNNYSE